MFPLIMAKKTARLECSIFWTKLKQFLQCNYIKTNLVLQRASLNFHFCESSPRWLIMFVLTRAEQGAKHRSSDYFHFESGDSANYNKNTKNRHLLQLWDLKKRFQINSICVKSSCLTRHICYLMQHGGENCLIGFWCLNLKRPRCVKICQLQSVLKLRSQ